MAGIDVKVDFSLNTAGAHDAFLEALDQDREPRVTGREALRVHRFIDAVLRASAERRTVAVEAD